MNEYDYMNRVIYEKCPNCGGEAYSEGVDNGVGYVYPPFHCNCGWCECCYLKGTESCNTKCTEYKYCYVNN